MKAYSTPQLTDFGTVASLTAADQTVNETDVFITATGQEIGLEGPASQIVCVDNNRDDICDYEQP